jgi:protein-tyrosine phosphatase
MLRRSFFLLPFLCLARDRQRQIVLEGAQNFRDIGGYPTRDGKHIKWGRVFRSDGLAKLTTADYEKLAQLRIRTVCDYRSSFEREREKTQWPGPQAPEILVLDIMSMNPEMAGKDPTRSFFERLMKPGATPEDSARSMAESMGTMALTGAPLYGKMMRRLLDSPEPLLFHCSAGKDRTGLSAALLMRVLGVNDEAIVEDYLLVNKLMPPEKFAAASAERFSAMTGQKLSAELLVPLMGTQAEWLTSAWQAIDAKYGSFDNYRRQALGISDRDQQKLRRALLE